MSEFFFYSKRAEFLKSQVENFTTQQRHRTLLDVCRTRWFTRVDGLDRFEEMFEVVTLTFQSIRDNVGGNWNIDTQNLAGSLFNACSEFTFIVSLLVSKYFIYLIIASHIGTATAGSGYTTSVREHKFSERWSQNITFFFRYHSRWTL